MRFAHDKDSLLSVHNENIVMPAHNVDILMSAIHWDSAAGTQRDNENSIQNEDILPLGQ